MEVGKFRRASSNQKLSRKKILTPTLEYLNQRQLPLNKNPSHIKMYLNPNNSSANTILSKSQALIKTTKEDIPINHDLHRLEIRLHDFLKTAQSIDNPEKKFKTEFKFYLDMLKKVSKFIQPFDKVVNVIIDNLSDYIAHISLKLNDEYKILNEKLTQKLKLLSMENIEFYKKNKDLKNELALVKRTVVYNETHFAIEGLLKELNMKSDYISKCNNEINEYKIREIILMKKLEGVTQSPISIDETNSASNRNKYYRRSQSIKSIPRILFKSEQSSIVNNISE